MGLVGLVGLRGGGAARFLLLSMVWSLFSLQARAFLSVLTTFSPPYQF